MKQKLLSSKILHENKWLSLVKQVFEWNGKTLTYYSIERQDCVVIIPMTKQRQILMLTQFRIPTREYSLEFPMGGIDEAETNEAAAIRELHEETGIRVEYLKYISSYFALPGLTKQRVHIFVAELERIELESYETLNLSSGEPIVGYNVVEFNELKKLIQLGVVHDSCTLVSFLHLMLNMENNEELSKVTPE